MKVIEDDDDDDPVMSQLMREMLWHPHPMYRRMAAVELGEHWAKQTIARMEEALDRVLPRQR